MDYEVSEQGRTNPNAYSQFKSVGFCIRALSRHVTSLLLRLLTVYLLAGNYLNDFVVVEKNAEILSKFCESDYYYFLTGFYFSTMMLDLWDTFSRMVIILALV